RGNQHLIRAVFGELHRSATVVDRVANVGVHSRGATHGHYRLGIHPEAFWTTRLRAACEMEKPPSLKRQLAKHGGSGRGRNSEVWMVDDAVIGQGPDPAKQGGSTPVPDQYQVILAENLSHDVVVTRCCGVLDRLDDETPGPEPSGCPAVDRDD